MKWKRILIYSVIIFLSFIFSSFQYYMLELPNYEKNIKEFLYFFWDESIKINEEKYKSTFFFKEVEIKEKKYCFSQYELETFDNLIKKKEEECSKTNNILNEYICSDINGKNINKLNWYILNFSKELKLLSFITSLKINKDYCISFENWKFVEINNKIYKIEESKKDIYKIYLYFDKNNWENLNKKINDSFLEKRILSEMKKNNYYLIYNK